MSLDAPNFECAGTDEDLVHAFHNIAPKSPF